VLGRAHEWSEAHPAGTDAAVAGALLVLLGLGLRTDEMTDGPVDVALTAALVIPLAWRRRAPVAVFATLAAVCLVQLAVGDHLLGADLCVAVALYSVVAHAARPWPAVAVVVSLIGVVLFAARFTDPPRLGAIAGLAAVLGAQVLVAAAFGDRRRNRLAHLEALRERARLLAAERDREAALAAARERNRIARELHDVLAHSLSVMIVQADGARYAARHDGEAAGEALETIAATGRDALEEMRRALGRLRPPGDGDDGAPPGPEPGLGGLGELVRRMAGAGLPVELVVDGPPRALPAAAGAALYRVAQEALTNVLRHADGPGRVDVRVRYAADAVELLVADDGRGGAAPDDGRGHGLRGMRERIALHGGTLRAGPRDGGGFAVEARIPAPAPVPAAPVP
jgi:signal transduction histidine kinase